MLAWNPSWGELLARADYISVHSPHNEETHHSLNADAFAQMKDGVVIVNTARGPIIKENDLIEALETGKVQSAGLDVLEKEPPDADNPLLAMPNVIVTPHVASASTRMRPTARRRVGREASRWCCAAVADEFCGQSTVLAQDAARALAALTHEQRSQIDEHETRSFPLQPSRLS